MLSPRRYAGPASRAGHRRFRLIGAAAAVWYCLTACGCVNPPPVVRAEFEPAGAGEPNHYSRGQPSADEMSLDDAPR